MQRLSLRGSGGSSELRRLWGAGAPDRPCEFARRGRPAHASRIARYRARALPAQWSILCRVVRTGKVRKLVINRDSHLLRRCRVMRREGKRDGEVNSPLQNGRRAALKDRVYTGGTKGDGNAPERRTGGRSGKFGEEGLHFGAGVFIALFDGGGDAVSKHPLCFFDALLADQELAVHEIGGDVIRVAFEESTEMEAGGGGVAVVHALEGEAVAGEGVVGFLGDKFFERLTAGFLLFGHWVVSYYTEGGREGEMRG